MYLLRSSLIVALVAAIVPLGFQLVAADQPPASAAKAAADLEQRIDQALSELSAEDRKLVEAQRFCPIWVHVRLGALGPPIKIETKNKPFFVCCEECVHPANKGGAKPQRLANVLKKATARMADFSAEDRAAAEAQKYCAQDKMMLGSMGTPIKLKLAGKSVFICCPDCIEHAKMHSKTAIQTADKLIAEGQQQLREQGLITDKPSAPES